MLSSNEMLARIEKQIGGGGIHIRQSASQVYVYTIHYDATEVFSVSGGDAPDRVRSAALKLAEKLEARAKRLRFSVGERVDNVKPQVVMELDR